MTVASGVAFASALASACADPEDSERELPDPPEGAELVLALGDLEVYKAFDGELCAGTLRRTELHIEGLAELFDMESPRARVFLYGDVEATAAACPRDDGGVALGGCAPWWGAHALPSTVRHELVHVFVRAATDGARTRPFLEEGVALRLQGDRMALTPNSAGGVLATYDRYEEIQPFAFEDLEAMIALRSPFGVPDVKATHFAAWAIDELGLDAVLDAHVETSKLVYRPEPAADADVGLALALSLGFPSLEDLHAAYAAGSALAYPPLPDTVRTFTSHELANGVPVDLSCAGELTEGPMSSDPDDALVARFRLDIRDATEHRITTEPSWPPAFFGIGPWWQPTEPAFESITEQLDLSEYGEGSGLTPWTCASSPNAPWGEGFLFFYPGRYEARVEPSLDERVTATVVVRDLGNDKCTDP